MISTAELLAQLDIPLWVIPVFMTMAIWSVIWKGLALWKAAAKKHNPIWFIILLVVNTVGILEILYIFVFSEMGKRENKKVVFKKKK